MSGHLHPVLGLARRLNDAFDVSVLSTAGAQAEIAASGVAGRALLAGADDLVRAAVNPPYAVGHHPWRLLSQFHATLALLERLYHDLLELWRESPPDLVIADCALPVAGSAAEACGIRWWTAHPSPV